MENGNELNQLLPGQPLRVGVDLIADKNSGALIVIGREIYDDAVKELDDLKSRMALEYELPPYDFIG